MFMDASAWQWQRQRPISVPLAARRHRSCKLANPPNLFFLGGAGGGCSRSALDHGTRSRPPATLIRAATPPPPPPPHVDHMIITWQIAVGALAGVTPFLVAAIEFSKRILAQRKCRLCGGSGLVQRDDYYARCPSCGGFLPWQSWKRFFTG